MLAVVLAVAFAGLGYRLVDLQVLRHDELSAKAQLYTQHKYLLEPRRGDILDCRGNVLATTVNVKDLFVDPTLLGSRKAEVAHALAPLLQETETKLLERFNPARIKNSAGVLVERQAVPLKSDLALEDWQKIQFAINHLKLDVDEKKLTGTNKLFYQNLKKAVFARDTQMRVYPNHSLAAHVVGFSAKQEIKVQQTFVKPIVGVEGIEASFNTKLSGVRGWKVTETDWKQHEVVSMRDQDVEAQDGFNVVLTIDSFVQDILETALAEGMKNHTPLSISGIVIRPKTGEILALANLPTFDPNAVSSSSPESRRNHVIGDSIEPGSTFKIVVVSGALNDQTVHLNDVFDCENGHFFFAGTHLRDHEGKGSLHVEEIITHSSNIGAAKIGIKMGQKRLYDYMHDFGFGVVTGVPLPAEARGLVNSLDHWTKVSIAQIPMGQGVSVTRLQMAMAMCAVANNGVLMRPMLVDRLEDRDHQVVAKYSPQRVRQVISESAARDMVTALKTVPTAKGTAVKAGMTNYIVAGKTGTAQKLEANRHYSHTKFISSFIGFFPADHPEVCISIVLDEPKQGYYGGLAAAPVFHEVAERVANYLKIRPDRIEEEPTGPLASPEVERPIRTAAIN